MRRIPNVTRSCHRQNDLGSDYWMPAGSGMIYTGRVVHGGGANGSTDQVAVRVAFCRIGSEKENLTSSYSDVYYPSICD